MYGSAPIRAAASQIRATAESATERCASPSAFVVRASQIPRMQNPAGAEAIGRRRSNSPYQRPTRNGVQDTSAMKRKMSPRSGAMIANWLFAAIITFLPENAGKRRFPRRSIAAPDAVLRDHELYHGRREPGICSFWRPSRFGTQRWRTDSLHRGCGQLFPPGCQYRIIRAVIPGAVISISITFMVSGHSALVMPTGQMTVQRRTPQPGARGRKRTCCRCRERSGARRMNG
ncbi:hypothetical protein DSECCO2_637690 [anaerobic digester metagenome]